MLKYMDATGLTTWIRVCLKKGNRGILQLLVVKNMMDYLGDGIRSQFLTQHKGC